MHQLIISDQKDVLPGSNSEHIEGVYRLGNGDEDVTICVRQGSHLIGYEYGVSSWNYLWKETVFGEAGGDGYSSSRYPWLVTDELITNRVAVLLRNSAGIRFYHPNKTGLALLSEDGRFHDMLGWAKDDHQLLWGRLYPNTDLFGFMTRDQLGIVKFYSVGKDRILAKKSYPLRELQKNLSLTPVWHSPDTDFFVTNLRRLSSQKAIVLRTATGIEFYEFNDRYLLDMVTSTDKLSKPTGNSMKDRLYFADLTHELYQDILHLNDSGLFVYQYNSSQNDYSAIHHDSKFTRSNGWLPRYGDSIRLIDMDSDGRDDLLFTGTDGITALTFDSDSWKSLLNPDSGLTGSQRYYTMVGSLPAIPPAIRHPSLFLQDPEGKVQWAQAVRSSESAMSMHNEIGPDKKGTAEAPSPISYHQIPSRGDASIPEEIIRMELSEKPILRWAEQWKDNFLHDSVDLGSGQVRFKLPLVEVLSSMGLGVHLALSYQSQTQTTDLSGMGWSIPALAKDYIYLEHRGSVFPDEEQYYLYIQGIPNLLKPVNNSEGRIRIFELIDQANVTIQYHESTQCWTIENETEKLIYGRANQNGAADALQWSLAWPNWRGSGTHISQLQPLVVGWYLNMRVHKHRQHKIYYHYEFESATLSDGKTYTSAVRLKSICDSEQVRLILGYAPKTAEEFTSPNPIDERGNCAFPVTLVHSHFLTGYSITTATYQQTLQFLYEKDNGHRLLKAIEQKFIPAHLESLFLFEYEQALDKPVLKSCTSPGGSTVAFDYIALSPLEIPTKGSYRYTVREKTKITYGSDYAILSSRSLDHADRSIILLVMNREMTLKHTKLTVDVRLKQSAIIEYGIQAYSNWFVVFVVSEDSEVMYVFDRHEETWSAEPTVFGFTKDAILGLSDKIIAAAEANAGSLKLFERIDDQSSWKAIDKPTNRSLTRLVVRHGLVIGFDDQQLWLFQRDARSSWKGRVLVDNLTGVRETLDRFDLDSETRQEILKALNQRGLQVFNNFIVLTTFREIYYGTFSFSIQLFLLNSQYRVVKTQEIEMLRENVLEITYKHENGVFQLGYDVSETGRFKVNVKALLGEDIEKIQSIKNKNLRLDAMGEVKEQIKQINEKEEWREHFRQRFLLDLTSMMSVHISPVGVFYGTDTLFTITGAGWKRESQQAFHSIKLGKHFVLESDSNQSLYKLSTLNDGKQSIVRELSPASAGQLVNRYPIYIAYQSAPDSVEVITFRDKETVGNVYTFIDEQLLLESDFQNLVTVTNASTNTLAHLEPMECLVRPLLSFLDAQPSKLQIVSKLALSDGDVQRITEYQRSFHDEGDDIYSERIRVIPGANKNLYGWYEEKLFYNVENGNKTKTKTWFEASGEEVLTSLYNQTSSPDTEANKNTSTDANPTQLFDSNNIWLISDFSPYNLADEMGTYYGFEAYEKNQIGGDNSAKTWRMEGTRVVERGFSFTGENYLEISPSSPDKPAFIEGVLRPRDQAGMYLATCWIHSRESLTLNKPAPYLKAILSTSTGQEIIGLLGEAKQQDGDWFYLEVEVDFQIVKQIYRDYLEYMTASNSNLVSSLPSPEDVVFEITLRVEVSNPNEIINLDHIRFSPITHDFKAEVFQSLIGKPTALIQANGLVTRTVYNRLQQEIASLKEDGQLDYLTSASRTGRLVPSPRGKPPNQKPNTLVFQPESGFYETFHAHALRSRWKVNDATAWRIAPGQLWHRQTGRHRIQANSALFDSTAAIRCYFALQDSQASLFLTWHGGNSFQFLRKSGNFSSLLLPDGRSIEPLPTTGEIIVMLEQNYAWLWFDGVLLLDEAFPKSSSTPWASFELDAKNQVLIEDFFVMNRPQLMIEYRNAFHEKIQVIHFEDSQTVKVTEILYDELGREAIATKPTRMHRKMGHHLLTNRPTLVSNANPASPTSIWHTGLLKGEVDMLNPADEGFAYTQTEYARNPLNEKRTLGLPGPDFSVTGRYATTLRTRTDISFLHNLFPISEGYRHKVEQGPNGTKRVAVFDKRNNQIARYVRVPGYNHQLSTYEYDEEKRLVKILPPLYHEKVDTAIKLTPWKPGEQHLSIEEKEWQRSLGIFFDYDKYGRLIRKTTPDTGTTEFLFNSKNEMRFMVSSDTAGQINKVVYFTHDSNGQLSQTGHLNQLLSVEDLRKLVDGEVLPNAQDHQIFDYSYDHFNPLSRGRIKYCITDNLKEPVVEELRFNDQQQVVTKTTLSVPGLDRAGEQGEFKREYDSRGRVRTLTYPNTVNSDHPLRLVYSYNRLGELIELSTSSDATPYTIKFTYNSAGQLESEQFQPNSQYSFTRRYLYNSPGFLEQLSDPFLTEEIAYTEKGYGQTGFGDGMVMRTAFYPSWTENADGQWFQLKDDALTGNRFSAACIAALKRTGYLTTSGRPVKIFNRDAEIAFPIVCRGRTGQDLAKLLVEKQPVLYYGHRYAYGNHQELVKAKYFTDETESLIDPLQSDSFAKEIPGMTNEESQQIWKLLSNGGYVTTDQQSTDCTTAVGKRGTISFFRDEDLRKDLGKLNDDYKVYTSSVKRLIVRAIGLRQKLSLEEFETTFLYWTVLRDQESADLLINQRQKVARQIYEMIADKGYLLTQSNVPPALDKKFTTILSRYSRFLPDIVQILSHHFAQSLGETAFDVESYGIDPNGNHVLFYAGFNRYELVYANGTNKIKSVKLDWPTAMDTDQVFPVQHDPQGNVIQALHKGISRIEYHPVSQRTTRIQLTNGRTLRFYYDAQGERILKREFSADGQISHETRYLRDENGRVLMDWKTTYKETPVQQIVTAYIYGPRGLLGFIRNDIFYNVVMDHSGSIRLVIRGDRVVAAYDYLPYGQLMRSFGHDPQTHIVYRYTGQEWDEETGLYNFHARLYDPSIGRFYQPDPKAQYFSPYKYAGNSPVSLVDPDGEFAIGLLIASVILGASGAYLGGAAANNRWNPADWDWKDPDTAAGMIRGGVAGAYLPFGFKASVDAIGIDRTVALGLRVSYLTTAAANQNFDFTKWQWDRPKTFNGAFVGFGAGSGFAGGISSLHNFANKAFHANNLGKGLFLTVSYTAGGGLAYTGGIMENKGTLEFWEWNWSNPGTLVSIIDGFDNGVGFSQGFAEIARGINKLSKIVPKQLGMVLSRNLSKRHAFIALLKNPKNPLNKIGGSLVMVYFMGSSANGELDITLWDLNSFSTYEGILNGIFKGKDLASMLKHSRDTKTNISPKIKETSATKFDLSSSTFQKLLLSIHKYRTMLLYRLKIKQQNQPVSFARGLDDRRVENMMKGKNKQPEAFQKFVFEQASRESSSPKLIEWQAEADQAYQKQREIFLDRDVDFLTHCRAARRRKRGIKKSKVCRITSTDLKTEELLSKKMRAFNLEPRQFLNENVISVGLAAQREINHLLLKENTPLRTNDNNNNPNVYQFRLKLHEKTSSVNDKKYLLVPTTLKLEDVYNSRNGVLDELLITSDNSLSGYYLVTGDTIRIDPLGPAKFIITAELQGCTLYARFDDDGSLVVHHFKLEPEKETSIIKEQRLDQEYSDGTIIKFQDYTRGKSEAPIGYTEGGGTYASFTTPLIYRDNEGNWHCAFQGITNFIDSKGVMVDFKHDGEIPVDIPIRRRNTLVTYDVGSSRGRRSLVAMTERFLENSAKNEEICSDIQKDYEKLNSNNENSENTRPDFIEIVNFPENKHVSLGEAISSSDSDAPASSGSYRLQFWPINMIKRTAASILSFVSSRWTETPIFSAPSWAQAEHPEWNEPPLMPIETPTLLEFGDQYLNNTDMNSNLTWMVLLVNKLTGYRPKAQKETPIDEGLTVELAIQSAALVDEFMDALLIEAESCGVSSTTTDILENPALYNKSLQLVRQKLAAGQLERIPRLLYSQVIQQQMGRIGAVSTKTQANELHLRITDALPRLQQRFLQQEREWFSHRNCSVKHPNCPSPINTQRLDNILSHHGICKGQRNITESSRRPHQLGSNDQQC